MSSSAARPIGSGICAEKEHSRQYTSHRQRLSNIKPAIDNKAPPVYPHLYQKLKKAQLEEERCAAIERDNRTLVNRMSRIMKRTGIDNGKPHEKVASLNKVLRKQELARITKENHQLLKRLQERQPTYNHLQWEQDRERNEQLCERICRHSYQPTSPSRTKGADSNLPPI